MRRALPFVAAIALVAIVVIGLTQVAGNSLGDGTDFDLPAAKEKLATAPPPLNALYAQGNELLGGGQEAFDQRIAELKGTPIIVNKWASWCGPCQVEFPVFQQGTLDHGKEVAFLGLNAGDKDPKARGFLDNRPLPFPSYTDPKEDISRDRALATGFPMTLFIGRDGEVAYIHTGPYRTQADLDEDIKRYFG